MFQPVHEIEVLPTGTGVGPVLVGPVPLAEFLDLVAALDGGLGGVVVAAACGDGHGDLLPLAGLERAPLVCVPFFLVGFDEVDRFLVRPERGLGFFIGRRCRLE